MPAKSAKQEKFMQAVANSPKFAKEVGVPQSVGKEFTKSKGGAMKHGMKSGTKKMAMGGMARAPMADPRMVDPRMAGTRGQMMAKGGGVETKGKTKGKTVKMAKGGMAGKASKRADGIAKKGKTSCKMV